MSGHPGLINWTARLKTFASLLRPDQHYVHRSAICVGDGGVTVRWILCMYYVKTGRVRLFYPSKNSNGDDDDEYSTTARVWRRWSRVYTVFGPCVKFKVIHVLEVFAFPCTVVPYIIHARSCVRGPRPIGALGSGAESTNGGPAVVPLRGYTNTIYCHRSETGPVWE